MNEMETAKALFFEGLDFLDAGRFADAEQRFHETLKLFPRSVPALANLAAAELQQGKLANARATAETAVAIDQANIEARLVLVNCLATERDFAGVVSVCDAILALDPGIPDVHSDRGLALSQLQRHEDALSSYDAALRLQPQLVTAHLNRGATLNRLRRHDEALGCFETAARIAPERAEAWLGRGNALFGLRRHADALAAYERAQQLAPTLAEAWLGRGNVLSGLKRYDEAQAAYDQALACDAALAEAWLGRGHVFNEQNRYDEALAAYDKALELKPDWADAWFGCGSVHEERKRYDAAFAAFDRAWTLQPTLPLVEGRRLHVKMHLCDWSGLDQEIAALHARVRQGAPASPPFTLLATSSAPAEQFACARSFTALQYPPPAQPAVPPPAGRRDKIRLGYVSGEFREQATSYLTADLYESHDRNRFELIAISTGRTEGSPMRRRLEAAFDAFEQVEGQSAAAIAETIRRHEVDVLIDLNGYFGVERTDVFRLRPAPVQVNFLGFPGTMGADFIDYIVADRVVLPPEHAPFYSEQIAWLPDCYQCNDRKRPIAETPKSRALAGLPESGFVFCCFDNPDKLTPAMFDVWMRILSRVEGSVLWLLDANPFVRGTLMREAERRGVAAGRLRFAPVRPLPEHLARLRLADLVLDTLPHNAHTTASDALWAGVPVLTALGTTFAGRVAASLLSASGLPELITSGWDEYENAAVALATDPARLAGLRAALARNRDSCRLFDTPRFARHLESAYTTMVSRARRGDRPASFAVEAIA